MDAGGFRSFRARGAVCTLVLSALLLFVGCSPAPPPPSASAAPPSASAAPPRTSVRGAPLAVKLGGKIGCASFPYGCGPTLSVLPAGTPVSPDWRPPASDPFWPPDYSSGGTADHFEPTAVGTLPSLPIGTHELVISLLGSYDVVSLNPDGSRALDFLGRCVLDVNVTLSDQLVSVLVTFTPGQDFQASCTIRRT